MKKLLISASFVFLFAYLFLAPVRQVVAEAPSKLVEVINFPELLNVLVRLSPKRYLIHKLQRLF